MKTNEIEEIVKQIKNEFWESRDKFTDGDDVFIQLTESDFDELMYQIRQSLLAYGEKRYQEGRRDRFGEDLELVQDFSMDVESKEELSVLARVKHRLFNLMVTNSNH